MEIGILRYFLWRDEQSFCLGLSIFIQGKESYRITGLDMLTFLDILDDRYMKLVSLSAQSIDHLYPRKYPSYWFLLEAVSTPIPYGNRKD